MDYQFTVRTRYSNFYKKLQQRLLQKSSQLKSLPEISHFCKKYEAAMKENNKISDNPSFYATGVDIEGLSEDEIIVAVSNCTKKKKKRGRPCCYTQHQKQNCHNQEKSWSKCNKQSHFEEICHYKHDISFDY